MVNSLIHKLKEVVKYAFADPALFKPACCHIFQFKKSGCNFCFLSLSDVTTPLMTYHTYHYFPPTHSMHCQLHSCFCHITVSNWVTHFKAGSCG